MINQMFKIKAEEEKMRTEANKPDTAVNDYDIKAQLDKEFDLID